VGEFGDGGVRGRIGRGWVEGGPETERERVESARARFALRGGFTLALYGAAASEGALSSRTTGIVVVVVGREGRASAGWMVGFEEIWRRSEPARVPSPAQQQQKGIERSSLVCHHQPETCEVAVPGPRGSLVARPHALGCAADERARLPPELPTAAPVVSCAEKVNEPILIPTHLRAKPSFSVPAHALEQLPARD
jgi:hypothetical protein